MFPIAIKNGVFMFLGFSIVFIIAHFMQAVDNYYLRLVNFPIQAFFIWKALQTQRKTHEGFQDEVMSNFPSGVSLGIMTSMIAYIPFTLIVSVYLRVSPLTLQSLQDQTEYGDYLSPFFTGVFMLAEGLIFALIGSYIITRIIQSSKQPV